MEYTAEQYLDRIENKRINSTPLYNREEMIDFAEKYAKQLRIGSVSNQRELLDLLTEIANSDTLYSNTRHRMIARKLLKSNCG